MSFLAPNCKKDVDDVSTVYTYKATSEEGNMEGTVLSCQSNSESTKPDKETMSFVRGRVSDHFSDDAKITLSFTKQEGASLASAKHEYLSDHPSVSVSEMMKRKMASNCAATGFQQSEITSINEYSCHYLGAAKGEDGEMGQNPFRTWRGHLASCDTTMEISESTEDDIRRIVHKRAGGDAEGIDKSKFVCMIQGMPTN